MNIKCHNCGYDQFDEKKVDEVFNIEGKIFLIKNIPAFECKRCGERYFLPATQKETMKIINMKAESIYKIEADVYSFS